MQYAREASDHRAGIGWDRLVMPHGSSGCTGSIRQLLAQTKPVIPMLHSLAGAAVGTRVGGGIVRQATSRCSKPCRLPRRVCRVTAVYLHAASVVNQDKHDIMSYMRQAMHEAAVGVRHGV